MAYGVESAVWGAANLRYTYIERPRGFVVTVIGLTVAALLAASALGAAIFSAALFTRHRSAGIRRS